MNSAQRRDRCRRERPLSRCGDSSPASRGAGSAWQKARHCTFASPACRGSERPENCPADSFQRRTGGSPGLGDRPQAVVGLHVRTASNSPLRRPPAQSGCGPQARRKLFPPSRPGRGAGGIGGGLAQAWHTAPAAACRGKTPPPAEPPLSPRGDRSPASRGTARSSLRILRAFRVPAPLAPLSQFRIPHSEFQISSAPSAPELSPKKCSPFAGKKSFSSKPLIYGYLSAGPAGGTKE